MKYLLLFFLSFICTVSLMAEHTKSAISCLVAMDGGKLELNWKKASDLDFVQYQLFYIDPISEEEINIFSTDNINQLSFIYPDANADVETASYFIKTIFSDEELTSEVVHNIYLNLAKKNGEGVLSWNIPFSSTTYDYKIFKGTYSKPLFYANSSASPFLESSFDCDQPIFYQLRIISPLACEYISNKVCVACFCNDYTEPPIVDSVSIQDGKVIIAWKPSAQKKVVRYLIYRKNGIINQRIHINEGINNTFFEDDAVDPCSRVEEYAISAVDSCGVPSPYTDFQQTLMIHKAVFNTCERSILIEWNAYKNPSSNILNYEVWGGEATKLPKLLVTKKPAEQQAYLKGLQVNKRYQFFIRVRGSSFSATSCTVEVKTPDYNRPDTLSLQQVSVNDQQQIELKIFSDPGVFIQGYEIFRSENKDGLWNSIGFIPFEGSFPLVFEDQEADVNHKIYYYRVQLSDSCGIERNISGVLQSELLQGQAKDASQNQLTWNSHETYAGGVAEYKIYRSEGKGQIPDTEIATIASSENSYTDLTDGVVGTDGYYNYRIEAVPQDPIKFDNSMSNWLILRAAPQVFMPNAFKPNGVNNRFKPAGKDVNPDGFEMDIFNRWGQEIFRTNDPINGWNGRIGSDLAPVGSYVYRVIFYDLEGKRFEMKGILILLGGS